ncbi:hypothetical protein [Anaplasma bovis]|uniref:hypothetical protein n=1 Tax=Anaplasma bovis TaxID=186733 RepID=UPI002FF0F364
MLSKFCNDDMEMNFVGGSLFTIIMSFLILLEFALSGVMFEYTPRFDIICMSLLCSRKIKVPCVPLLCVGVFRDIIYMLPLISSSVLCVFVGEILNGHRTTWAPREYLRVMTIMHCVLWVANCVVYREAASIRYLIFQVFVCTVAIMLFSYGSKRKNA